MHIFAFMDLLSVSERPSRPPLGWKQETRGTKAFQETDLLYCVHSFKKPSSNTNHLPNKFRADE